MSRGRKQEASVVTHLGRQINPSILQLNDDLLRTIPELRAHSKFEHLRPGWWLTASDVDTYSGNYGVSTLILREQTDGTTTNPRLSVFEQRHSEQQALRACQQAS